MCFIMMVEMYMCKFVLLCIGKVIDGVYGLFVVLLCLVWVVVNVFLFDYVVWLWWMWCVSDFCCVDGIEGLVNWDVVVL